MIIVTGVDRTEVRLRQIRARMLWLEMHFQEAEEVSSYYMDQYLRLSDENIKLQFVLDRRRGVA